MLTRSLSSVIRQARWLSTGPVHLQQVAVDPYCRIHVKTTCPLTVRPFDLLDCPDANLVKATLSRNQTQLDITVGKGGNGEGQQIVHISEKLTEFFGQDEILLELPVKADLSIDNTEPVTLSDFQSDSIEVQSLTGIKTRNIKGEQIRLVSGGEIQCQGTTLAKTLSVKTDFDGDILLDKVLGDNLLVQSNEGSISINSCYSQSSKITTKSGDLNLKNIHRNCEINVEKSSNVQMTGFNGNLLLTVGGGTIDLQIAELHGESVILADNSTDIHLKLSEEVTSSTYVHAAVNPDKLHLDEVLEPVRGAKESGATTLNTSGCPNKLFVQTTDGQLRIKQLSWTESIFGKGVPE